MPKLATVLLALCLLILVLCQWSSAGPLPATQLFPAGYYIKVGPVALVVYGLDRVELGVGDSVTVSFVSNR